MLEWPVKIHAEERVARLFDGAVAEEVRLAGLRHLALREGRPVRRKPITVLAVDESQIAFVNRLIVTRKGLRVATWFLTLKLSLVKFCYKIKFEIVHPNNEGKP